MYIYVTPGPGSCAGGLWTGALGEEEGCQGDLGQEAAGMGS